MIDQILINRTLVGQASAYQAVQLHCLGLRYRPASTIQQGTLR